MSNPFVREIEGFCKRSRPGARRPSCRSGLRFSVYPRDAVFRCFGCAEHIAVLCSGMGCLCWGQSYGPSPAAGVPHFLKIVPRQVSGMRPPLKPWSPLIKLQGISPIV